MSLEPLDPRQELGLEPEQIPRHIAIIMDGNGRWAKQRGQPRTTGHEQGAETVDRITTLAARLGIKQLSEDPWESLKKAYPERSIVEGEVTNITDFGVFVRVQGGIEGLINKAQLSDPREEPFEKAVEKITVGNKIRAVVTELSPSRQKLSLSVRELARQEQRHDIQKYIGAEKNDSTFTLGDILKDKESK